MIAGIGVDTVEISRVAKACEREHFVNRIFTRGDVTWPGTRCASTAPASP